MLLGMHPENHEHVHDNEKQLQDRPKLLAITALQACMAGVSFFIGTQKQSAPFFAETAHDIGDTVINGTRVVSTYREVEHSKWYSRFRRASYTVISSYGMFVAGSSLVSLPHVRLDLKDMRDSKIELFGAGVIAGGNWLSYRIAKSLEADTLTTADSIRHNRLDRDVTMATAIGITVGSVFPYVNEVVAVGVGAYTAWHMRPTQANLSHQH